MTDEIVEDVGGGSAPAPVDNTPVESTPNDFSIPDSYSESQWANGLESYDDVWKKLANSQELIGKKTLNPIDYATASAEDISAYHKSLVPEDGGAYKFSEESDADFSSAMVPVLQEAGIHPSQLAILEPALNKIASELTAQEYSKDRSSEGYESLAKEAFGDTYKDAMASIEKSYMDHASDDVKAFLDSASNNDRIMFDRTVQSIMEAKDAEIAKIKAEYGVTETGAQSDGEPVTKSVNIDDQIAENFKEITNLSKARGSKDWGKIEQLKAQRRELFDKKAKMAK